MNGITAVRRARTARAARVLVLAAGMLAAGAITARANADDVHVSVEVKDNVYRIRGAFTVAAPESLAWAVLTDYDHIGTFVTAIRSSAVGRDSAGRVTVRQAAAAGVFPFRKTVHVALEVSERSLERIEFRDTLGRDFRSYEGRWELAADSAGTHVSYALAARPRSPTLAPLARALVGHDADDLLEQVRAEILRRFARPAAHDD